MKKAKFHLDYAPWCKNILRKKNAYGPLMENVAYLPVMSVWAEAGLRCLGGKRWMTGAKRKWFRTFPPKPAIASGHDSQHKLWHMWFFFFFYFQPLLW